MKYFIRAILLLIVAIFFCWLLTPNKVWPTYTNGLQAQRNPFTTTKDSSNIIWARGAEFFTKMKGIYTGGDLQQGDSVYYLPYYNSHRKGDCVRVERHTVDDSVSFYVQCWYSQNQSERGAKEIALFMQKHVSRYDDK
jgi:hypothetical protein